MNEQKSREGGREGEKEAERKKRRSPEAYENHASEETVHTNHLLLKVCFAKKDPDPLKCSCLLAPRDKEVIFHSLTLIIFGHIK